MAIKSDEKNINNVYSKLFVGINAAFVVLL